MTAGKRTSAIDYMLAAALGREATVCADVQLADAIWGRTAADGGADHPSDSLARRHPRRPATTDRVRRTAQMCIDALQDEAQRAAIAALPPLSGLDVWMYGVFERRAGVVPSAHIETTTATNACAEFGALMAHLGRMLGDAGARWPMTDDARHASDGMQRCNRNPDRVENAIAPKEWHEAVAKWSRRTEVGQRDSAVVALGGSFGLPVTMSSHIRTREISTIHDKVADRTAVILQYEVREAGGLKVRRATSTKPAEKVNTAASSPGLNDWLVPWWRKQRDRGAEWLFPHAVAAKQRSGTTQFRLEQSEPMRTTALQPLARKVKTGATWHSFRFGVARALLGVHRVTGGPSGPVSTEVKNTIQLRSNRALRGSADAYVLELVDPLLEATRCLHMVDLQAFAGMISHGRDAGAALGDAPFAGHCARCQKFLPAEGQEGAGFVCDRVPCLWTVCTSCVSAAEVSGTLFCPAHRPA